MRHRVLCGLLLAGLLPGCRQDAVTAPPLTRVKVVTAELSDFAPERADEEPAGPESGPAVSKTGRRRISEAV